MARTTAFLECAREEVGRRPVAERVRDYSETELALPEQALCRQAARCMDCGIPFCHALGCPLASRVPDVHDLICRGRWREAAELLHAANNFPEITGRVCPAPCEAACTLSINDQPVLIRHVERQVAERAFREGWVGPTPAARKTGKSVAVVGSGPAGLAAAQQLAGAGHRVVVFEKDDRPGGLLRYGIPDFKLDKGILDRRLRQLQAEGVEFQTGVVVGDDISARYLRKMFDAVCLTLGAGQPRDLAVPGRGLDNIHFAVEFLARQNRLNAGQDPGGPVLSARDKVVVVIGGGDTGSDCVGTAVRQQAREVHLFEILPKPPEGSNPATPWPAWPNILRTSSSHEEGCRRRWCVVTKRFTGVGTRVAELHGAEVEWTPGRDGMTMKEVPGTDFRMKVDLVLLAMGFVHVAHGGLVESLGLPLDARGNLAVDESGMTAEEGIFAAGDAVEGASLVVRAIAAGRRAADSIDRWLSRNG